MMDAYRVRLSIVIEILLVQLLPWMVEAPCSTAGPSATLGNLQGWKIWELVSSV